MNVIFAKSIKEIMDYSFLLLTCWASDMKAGVIYYERKRIQHFVRMHRELRLHYDGTDGTYLMESLNAMWPCIFLYWYYISQRG